MIKTQKPCPLHPTTLSDSTLVWQDKNIEHKLSFFSFSISVKGIKPNTIFFFIFDGSHNILLKVTLKKNCIWCPPYVAFSICYVVRVKLYNCKKDFIAISMNSVEAFIAIFILPLFLNFTIFDYFSQSLYVAKTKTKLLCKHYLCLANYFIAISLKLIEAFIAIFGFSLIPKL